MRPVSGTIKQIPIIATQGTFNKMMIWPKGNKKHETRTSTQNKLYHRTYVVKYEGFLWELG